LRLDVIGFGALNLDKIYTVGEIAGAGQETFVESLTVSPGGSAANTIAGLARLGSKTGYIGKLANDQEGRYLLDNLKRDGTDTSGIIISRNGRSGVCVGFVDHSGERALYIDPGVNDDLISREVGVAYADSSQILHLTSFVGDAPFDAQRHLVKMSKKAWISLDPGELYAKRGLLALYPILKRTSVFLPNEKELRSMTKKGYRRGSKDLLARGVETVAVKLAERGCYVSDGTEGYLIPAYKRKAKDTTGAGDAFCAGFLYGLLNEKDLYVCGKLGNFVASRCISEYGARNGLPSKLDVPNL